MPNFMPEYSILKPETSSDSPSAMSNGARPSSAIAAIRKITAASGAIQMYQTSWPWMMAFMPMEPEKMVGIRSMVSIGTSKETMTATWRKAPIRANLLFDDQPAMMIDSVPIAPAAMIYSTPMFRSTPTKSGYNGTTAHRIKTDIIERIGARL